MSEEKKECGTDSKGCCCSKKVVCLLLGAILLLGIGYCLGKCSGHCHMMGEPKMCPIMQPQQTQK